VQFGGAVTSGAVDDILVAGLAASERDHARHVIFDFADTTFIEAPALQMVIAAALWLTRNGEEFSLRIPRSQKVRDFWRAWDFPQALATAMGVDSFSSLVPISDRHFFGEKRKYYLPVELPGHPGFPGGSVRSKNFFGFYSMSISSRGPSIRLAYEEKDYWNVSHIHAILTDKLGKESSYFPSRVVFEAVLNALRHPAATILQTAAIDQKTKEGRLFTVHFWDDGMSMAETMQRAIDGTAPVRGMFEQDLDRKYLVIQSEDGVEGLTQRTETAHMALERGIESQNALLATIMPAVSSDLFGLTHAVADEVTEEDIRFGRRGMGLFVLINAAVEILGGSVAFRTANHFMNIRKTNARERKQSGASLRVRLKRRSRELPPFLGNLVTVRIPYRTSK
jgi:hypothetical protein